MAKSLKGKSKKQHLNTFLFFLLNFNVIALKKERIGGKCALQAVARTNGRLSKKKQQDRGLECKFGSFIGCHVANFSNPNKRNGNEQLTNKQNIINNIANITRWQGVLGRKCVETDLRISFSDDSHPTFSRGEVDGPKYRGGFSLNGETADIFFSPKFNKNLGVVSSKNC